MRARRVPGGPPPALAARVVIATIAALILAASAPAAQAHTRSETQSSWSVDGRQVRAEVLVPDAEAQRLLGRGPAPIDAQTLGHHLERATEVRTAEAPCTPDGPPHSLGAAAGWTRLALAWRCSGPPASVRWSACFAECPDHRHVATVRDAQGRRAEHLLDRRHDDFALDAGSSLDDASLADFVALGIEHIVTGPDHQCFLLGLMLLSRRLRDLVAVVTGFTLGHSLTLAAAVLGWLRPTEHLNDALVGMTIALLGAEIAVQRLGVARGVALAAAALLSAAAAAGTALGIGPPPAMLAGLALLAGCYLLLAPRLVDARAVRLGVTMVFGLVHGFTFAASLVSLGLPRERIATLLLGFNLGVELAQLLLIASVALLARAIARAGHAVPRAVLADAGAAVLVGLGLYWAVVRGYGAP